MRRSNRDPQQHVRPSHRSTTLSTSSATTKAAGGSVLVNLDVYIQRATIGHDISPEDDDLIVLFRRNSKEITSEPARWHGDHVAEWNQHLGIQTSLLRQRKPSARASGAYGSAEYQKKEYEVVLVALPSHSAVALFVVDFADVINTQHTSPKPKSYRISPIKCRDLAATLEFELVWEYAHQPSGTGFSQSVASTTSSASMVGIPPLKTHRQVSSHYENASVGRRTNVSVVSIGSQSSDPAGDGVGANCSDCRSAKRRLERKELQVLQLETFLKESQKRIDSLVFENEELLVREQAETRNAIQFRSMNLRLLQELEMAFQFCATQVMQAKDNSTGTSSADTSTAFMFLPQFEFMERIKGFHEDLNNLTNAQKQMDWDPDNPAQDNNAGRSTPSKKTKATTGSPLDAWAKYDFITEMKTALERNQRLQNQLELLSRSLVYDVHEMPSSAAAAGLTGMTFNNGNVPAFKRTVTNASTTTDISSSDSVDSLAMDNSRPAPVLTMTEQINNLERENFMLKAKLESAMSDLKHHTATTASETADTTSTSSNATQHSNAADEAVRMELDQLRDDKAALQAELENARAELNNMSGADRRVSTASILSNDSMSSAALGGHSLSNLSMNGHAGATPAPGGFLNKIYMDVGKAKIVLEEKVKKLRQQLQEVQLENAKLRAKLEGRDDVDDVGSLAVSAIGPMSEVLSEVDEGLEPTQIIELAEEDEVGNDNAAATGEQNASMDAHNRVTALEKQLADMSNVLESYKAKVTAKEREIDELERKLDEQTQQITRLETDSKEAKQEIQSLLQTVMKAQDQAAKLEKENEALKENSAPGYNASVTSATSQSSFVVTGAETKSEEIAELNKQLKLAKQECMQLRYRSNNLESVHEKLEEALKEKKTLLVKLTALEGQLYEQRSRTISGNNISSMDASTKDAMVDELQRQLDQKGAQLLIAQREVEMMRRQATNGTGTSAAVFSTTGASGAEMTLEQLNTRVQTFASELQRMAERCENQTRQLDAMADHVREVTEEKGELERIVAQMLAEMEFLDRTSPVKRESDYAYTEDGEGLRQSDALRQSERGSGSSLVTAAAKGSVLDRYTGALTSRERKHSNPGNGPQSGLVGKINVAHLIRNFSNDDAAAAVGGGKPPVGSGPGARGGADLRSRNVSAASSSQAQQSRKQSTVSSNDSNWL